MHRPSIPSLRRGLAALVVAAGLLAAGCHRHNYDSGFGNVFVTVTDQPGDFASYVVHISTISFLRSDGVVVGTNNIPQETVDFTKLDSVAELLGNTQIPAGTYTSATITLDYTGANVSVIVNGQPQKATVVDRNGASVTTQPVTIDFDPANPLTIVNTFATTSAQRLAVDVDLAASTVAIDTSVSPAKVTVRPFITAATAAADTKLIRVRGPLINSSVDLQTFTVYVRPFADPNNNIGSVTMFDDANTLITLNGATFVGQAGINALSKASAGTTITATYATYEPTLTPSATAAKFHPRYVIAGSTLEDVYTAGLDGEVVARSGDTLTLRGSTLTLYNGLTYLNQFNDTDATVTVGPQTLVTADDDASLTSRDYHSIAVGQHIVARGVYSATSTGAVQLDATGTSSVNTGSVRLLQTSLYGTLVASASGTVTMNLAGIDGYPVSAFAFAGNGVSAASDPNPSGFVVSTGAIALPSALTVGGPVWVGGLVAPFASAPPDFLASTVDAEATVPASLRVTWTAATATPFSAMTSTALTVDLGNASLASAVLRIGAATIDMHTLSASPQIVPQSASTTQTGLPPVFAPRFSVGDPTKAVNCFGSFATYVQTLGTDFATAGAVALVAQGLYDPATNTFSASSIDLVL